MLRRNTSISAHFADAAFSWAHTAAMTLRQTIFAMVLAAGDAVAQPIERSRAEVSIGLVRVHFALLAGFRVDIGLARPIVRLGLVGIGGAVRSYVLPVLLRVAFDPVRATS